MSSGRDPHSEPIRIMRQRLAATLLPFPPALQQVLEAEWLFLATCGTWFSGSQRVRIAEAARSTDDARRREAPAKHQNEPVDGADEISPASLDAAAMVALAPATLENSDIERWESAGLNRFELIEIVGIVSRLHAVDTLLLLNGVPVADLPSPLTGRPRRRASRRAKQRASRLPTVAPGAIGALSGVPAESEARDRLQRALFGADRQLALPGLTHLQVEFLATKTSIVNQCVYWLLGHTQLLRESAEADGIEIDATALFRTDRQVGVPDEAALAGFADASLRSDRVEPITHLTTLIEAIGDEAALAATATIASFQMTNRVIESASLRLTPRMRQLAAELGVAT